MSKHIQFNAGDVVSIGDAVYDVMIGNSNDSPLVGISYMRADGNRTNTQYVHWAMLTLIPTIDYSAAVSQQYAGALAQ